MFNSINILSDIPLDSEKGFPQNFTLFFQRKLPSWGYVKIALNSLFSVIHIYLFSKNIYGINYQDF